MKKSISDFAKRLLAIFVIVLMVIAPPLVNAGLAGTASKYVVNAVKAIPGGARVEATATTTGARHVINHGVSAEVLGKGIGAGIVQFGVSTGLGLAFQAITGLAFDAVDWVMDPANNQIRYAPKAEADKCPWFGTYGTYYAPDFETACKRQAELVQAQYSYYSDRFTHKVEGGRCYRVDHKFNDISDVNLRKSPTCDEYKNISLTELAAKDLELAEQGNPAAQKDIVDLVKHQAQNGELDSELDAAGPVDLTKDNETKDNQNKDNQKKCPPGYVLQNGKCEKPKEPPKKCPEGTIKVGEVCIAADFDNDKDDKDSCGDCCDQLIQILQEMARMNESFYSQSLNNDKLLLFGMDQLNEGVVDLNSNTKKIIELLKNQNKNTDDEKIDYTEILNAIKELRKSIDDNHKELYGTIKQNHQELLQQIKDVNKKLDTTNEKLDVITEQLEKINENLEKMQKCNETEFNSKVCGFLEWMQKPFQSEHDGKLDVKDGNLTNIDQNKVKFKNQCPAPKQINLTVLGQNFGTEMNYQPLCDFFSQLRPFVVGMGWVAGAFIIAGRRGGY